MAVVLQEIVDSDFEYFVKITTTGTNSGSSVYDASAAAGAATDPRTTITGIAWYDCECNVKCCCIIFKWQWKGRIW